MAYTLHALYSKRSNYGAARKSGQIRYIVFHYTGNRTDTAKANANYFASHVVEASAHYFVDDTTVYQSVPDLYTAWSVGGKKWSDCTKTGGGKMYGTVRNTNSISIEMCSHSGKITQATQDNAVALAAKLMKKYNIPASHCCRHFDVNGKHCPGWVGWYGTDQSVWNGFRQQLSSAVATSASAISAGKDNAGTSHPNAGSTRKSVDAIAREVIAGKWGNGTARIDALEKAGYDATQVQRRVNELLR